MLAPLVAASVPGTAGAAAVMAEVLCAAAGLAEASAIRRSSLPMASVMVLAMPPLKERCCLLSKAGGLLTMTAAHAHIIVLCLVGSDGSSTARCAGTGLLASNGTCCAGLWGLCRWSDRCTKGGAHRSCARRDGGGRCSR